MALEMRTLIVCSFLSLTISVLVSGDTICNLDNYDLSTLEREDYWSISITSEQCDVSVNATCVLYFGVCQSLPVQLGCGSNSGVCRHVIPTGNNVVQQNNSIGRPTSSVQILDDSSGSGFAAFYEEGSDTQKCNKTNTVINFQCNETAIWHQGDQDVTKYLISYGDKNCLFLIDLYYSGACVQAVPVIPGCNALEHFDLSSIRNAQFFKATVPSSHCKNPLSTGVSTLKDQDDGTCDLFFSFCNPLPNGICYDSVFCEFDALRTAGFSYGKFDEKLEATEDSDYMGFTISAYGGTKTKDCPDGLLSTFLFNCSESADWSSIGYNISKFVTAEPNIDNCQFNVIFQYNGACTSYRPAKSERSSPFGGILIGIFFAVLILYFLIGAIIQFARGKRGPEIIPNYKLWNMFFILVLEGCQFTLDAVTCFQFKTSHHYIQHDYEKL